MNKKYTIKYFKGIIAIGCLAMPLVLLFSAFTAKTEAALKTGILTIRFINTANGKSIALRDSTYQNFFGEQYRINKLKYYVSNFGLLNDLNQTDQRQDCYLVDAAKEENSMDITIPQGKYNQLNFLLGIDSLRNCSGAQTGALDPMNDMFWTWNSGYVMFKLEGNSADSKADLNRIEHHIGGYKGPNNVARQINLSFSNPLEINAGKITELTIEMNLDHYWHATTDIKIADLPMCMITGEPALKVASNFSSLFSIKALHTKP